LSVSSSLRRLLAIRDLQEEQCKLALESALGEFHRLEHALQTTHERDRRGRSLIHAGTQTGQLTDRLAGQEESHSASLHAAALVPRIDAKGDEVEELRRNFQFRRVERRQVETLIQETEQLEAIEAARRGQQSLDNWYSSQKHRKSSH